MASPVATTTAAPKNVDYEFVEGLPEELTCSICMKVLCEPHLVNCCEQQFCKSCLDKWCKKNRSCPHCRSTEYSTMLLKQRSWKIGQLKVYCPNKRHGCKAELKISECDDHISTTNDKGCQYVNLDCPNNCAAKVFRGEMKTHAQEECPKRAVKCVHCNLEGEHQVIVGDHVNTCPSFPLPCPRGCGAGLLRKDLDAHRSTCPHEPVLCPFRGLGCKTEVCRQDLAKHVETSTLEHMTVLAESHTALQNKVQAIASVLRNASNMQSSQQIAQIYTILTDSSTLALGGSLNLDLSESNKRASHHYIIMSQPPPKPSYKLKLQWKMTNPDQPRGQETFIFELFSVIDDVHPAIAADLKFDVLVGQQTVGRVCCEKPQDKESGATPLGTVNVGYQPLNRAVLVQLQPHNPRGCQCKCHPTPTHSCKHCGLPCLNAAQYQNHQCTVLPEDEY